MIMMRDANADTRAMAHRLASRLGCPAGLRRASRRLEHVYFFSIDVTCSEKWRHVYVASQRAVASLDFIEDLNGLTPLTSLAIGTEEAKTEQNT